MRLIYGFALSIVHSKLIAQHSNTHTHECSWEANKVERDRPVDGNSEDKAAAARRGEPFF